VKSLRICETYADSFMVSAEIEPNSTKSSSAVKHRNSFFALWGWYEVSKLVDIQSYT
jgi:hypothetical protein